MGRRIIDSLETERKESLDGKYAFTLYSAKVHHQLNVGIETRIGYFVRIRSRRIPIISRLLGKILEKEIEVELNQLSSRGTSVVRDIKIIPYFSRFEVEAEKCSSDDYFRKPTFNYCSVGSYNFRGKKIGVDIIFL